MGLIEYLDIRYNELRKIRQEKEDNDHDNNDNNQFFQRLLIYLITVISTRKRDSDMLSSL